MRSTNSVWAAGLALALGALGAVAQETAREKAREPAPQPAAATNRFDGDWTLRVACAATADAQPVAVDMPASILNGRLFGSNGALGYPGVMQVEGTVEPDGRAQFQARGRTASPATAVGHPPAGTPYSYDVEARFDAATMRGTGRHAEDRPCDYSFVRR